MTVRALPLTLWAVLTLPSAALAADMPEKVSFHKQIRPIFQANCNGCHQPAKPEGAFDTTSIAKLLKPGESGKAGIVAGKPDESHLLQQIIPKDGKAAMPQGKDPLVDRDIQLIRQWIAEGAVDDSPANATSSVDAEHPPVYTRPPVISSIDYSPDGSLIAVAGFHEVLLHKADGSGLVARLIGLAERIESVRFSPDGKQLAVAGGLPGRLGEVQIWDVEGRKL
ncbi:MAG TPA: c-type cytochrome domain-containing protein, partial [Planctomycetaceae bacterium]|nr:c-type cytochrome domain-containing protein [Planctomycetaceae bacterium]